MQEPFDPYYKWLGIPPEEQPPNHYRLLGIKLFETDADVIAHAADRQMNHVRHFQNGPNSRESQKLLNQLAAAVVCLLSPEKKAAYDAQLRQRISKASTVPPPPAPTSAGEIAPPLQGMSVPPPIPLQQPGNKAAAVPLSTVPVRRSRASRKARGTDLLWWSLGALCVAAAALLVIWRLNQPPTTDRGNGAAQRSSETKPKPIEAGPKATEKPPDANSLLPSGPDAKELISAIDPEKHSGLKEAQYQWRVEGGVLISPRARYATLAVPEKPPEEYVLALLVELTAGHDTLGITVPIAGSHCTIALDGQKGRFSGLSQIDKQHYNQNESTRRGRLFEPGKPVAVVCTIRKTGIQVRYDGQTVIDWQGDPKRLSALGVWRAPDHEGISLGVLDAEYRISRLILAPLPPETPAKEEPAEQPKTDDSEKKG